MNKTIIIASIAVVLVGGGAFYGGVKYGQSNSSQRGSFQNLSAEERQQRIQQAGIGGRAVNGAGIGGLTAGEVISKDEQSITLNLRDGGSKIVFYSASVEISKFASGTMSDVAVGASVMVTGKTNTDGSVTAELIQLRPSGAGFGARLVPVQD